MFVKTDINANWYGRIDRHRENKDRNFDPYRKDMDCVSYPLLPMNCVVAYIALRPSMNMGNCTVLCLCDAGRSC